LHNHLPINAKVRNIQIYQALGAGGLSFDALNKLFSGM